MFQSLRIASRGDIVGTSGVGLDVGTESGGGLLGGLLGGGRKRN